MKENVEVTHPKLHYRMQREPLMALKAWAGERGMPVGNVLQQLAEALLRGDITLTARNVNPWEKQA